MTDSVRGAAIKGMTRPSKRFATGRVCAKHGCQTKLSQYNKAEYCHAHAPVGDAFCQANGDQAIEGFPDRCLADAEQDGELLLSQPFSRGIFPGDDPAVKVFEDFILEGFFLEALKLNGWIKPMPGQWTLTPSL